MSSKPLLPSFWEESTVYHLVSHAAEKYGNATAYIYGDTKVSFLDLEERVLDCSAGLWKAGVRPGDRVAVLAEDRPEWVYATFGVASIGAHPVFIPTHYTPREIHHGLTLTGVDTVIAQDWTTDGNILERYESLFFEVGSTSDDSVVIEDSLADQLARIFTINAVKDYVDARAFEDVLTDGRDYDLPDGVVDTVEPTDTAAVLFTSGTTSMPKAVVRTHENFLPHAVDMGIWYDRTESDALLDLFPNPSITATNQLLMAVAHGCTYHLVDHYDVDRAIDVLTRHELTSVSGVDTMFRDLLAHPQFSGIDTTDINRVFLAMAGGVDPELGRRVEDAFGAPMENPYGMSETNAFTLRSKPSYPFEARIQAGGRPGYKTGVIVDPDVEVGDGRDSSAEADSSSDHLVGEFCVKGITVTPGYDRNEDANESAFDADGWFHTDDTGSLQCINGEYYYYFSGRLDDMFQVGGNNVSPVEIEAVITEIDGVSWAGVIGIPHDRMGSVPVAFTTLDDPESDSVEPADVTAYCEGRLASHKVPRTVFVIQPSEIPTEAGVNGEKLRRDRLRDRATERIGDD